MGLPHIKITTLRGNYNYSLTDEETEFEGFNELVQDHTTSKGRICY